MVAGSIYIKPIDEAIIWHGRPSLLKAFFDYFIASLSIPAIIILITSFFSLIFSGRWLILKNIDIQYYLIAAVFITGFSLAMIVPLLFHKYAVTPRHLYIKKWRTWTAYPLDGIRKIKFVQPFPAWLFGTHLEIQVITSVPREKEKAVQIWGGEHIRLEYPDNPYRVKDIIEGAMKGTQI